MAMDTLKELFLDSLSPTSVDPQLLKKIQFYYTKFIDRLEAVAFDNLATTRNKAINTMADLLVKHPDNKKYIMEKLVNKIGDKVPKIATHASHLIEQIINDKKPELKEMALTEAERFLNRPKLEQKAQYYTLCLLNHFILSRKNPDLANKLLEIYLRYFSTQIKQGSVDSKLMGAILIGINRAYPFSKLKLDIFEQQLQVLYTIVHYVNYTMSIQALVLIHTILSRRLLTQKIPIEDRFYNTVYNHLLHAELQICSKQQSILNMIFTLVSQDKVIDRQKAFIKRLLQVGLSSPAPLSCSILLVVIKLVNAKSAPQATALPESAPKRDRKEDQLAKFIDLDDDDEERYEDIPDIDDDTNVNNIKGEKRKQSELMDRDNVKKALLMSAKISTNSWQHNNSRISDDNNKDYDALARNPKYCRASNAKLWELHALRKHHHPSVALFANKVISGEYYVYDGDALEDFSVKNFLDRFISRNPKKSLELENEAKIQAHAKKVVATHSSKCLFSRTLRKKRIEHK